VWPLAVRSFADRLRRIVILADAGSEFAGRLSVAILIHHNHHIWPAAKPFGPRVFLAGAGRCGVSIRVGPLRCAFGR